MYVCVHTDTGGTGINTYLCVCVCVYRHSSYKYLYSVLKNIKLNCCVWYTINHTCVHVCAHVPHTVLLYQHGAWYMVQNRTCSTHKDKLDQASMSILEQ